MWRLNSFGFMQNRLQRSFTLLIYFFFVSAAIGNGGFIRHTDQYYLIDDIDRWHANLSARLLLTAAAVDDFFVDERSLDERQDSHVRVNTSIRYEDLDRLTFRVNLSAQIALPKVRDEIRLLFDTEGKERDIGESFRTAPDVPDNERSVFAGLRYVTRETRRSLVTLDGGLRWRNGPVPVIRVRGRRTFVYDVWAIRATQTFFWREDRGFGEQTRLDFERMLDDQHFLRLSPSKIWSETSQGLDLRHVASVVQIRSPNTMIGVELDVQGHTHTSAKVDKFEAAVRWRQRGHRDWLFFEVAPGMAFKREFDFEMRPILTLRCEILFGSGYE